MKAFIFVFLALNLSFGAMAQYMNVRCAQVNEDGSTTIIYQRPLGGGADGYVVEALNEDGTDYYEIWRTHDPDQTTYTDNTLNANLSSVQYRVTAISTGAGFYRGHIRTIHLTATPNQNGTVSLAWTDLGSMTPNGSIGNPYKVYAKRQVADTEWQFRADVTTNQYIDTIPYVCSDTLCYRIELENTFGCVSRSNQIKFEVTDMDIPDPPILQLSTINLDSQQLNLNWIPSTSDDVLGYVVCAGSPCIAIDTVWGAEASTYVCEDCDVQTLNSLAIMAFDTCFNTSLRTETHTNMVLVGQHQACSDKASLSWNAYQDFASGLQHYNIYAQYGENAAYNLLTTTTNTNIEVPIEQDAEHCAFYIEAVAQDGLSALSNLVIFELGEARQVDFIEIRRVSVRENNMEVELELYVDASLVVNNYRLERSEDGKPYSFAASVPYSGDNTVTYNDHLPSSAAEHTYSYIFYAPDECQTQYTASKPVVAMQLKIESSEGNINLLSWTPYSGWDNGVGTYEVYRYYSSGSVSEQISTTTATTFTDNTNGIMSSTDRISYYVQVNENGVGSDGKSQTANSNSVYSTQETIIYIPNAFTPKGANNTIFKPQCYFVRQGTYSMRIFNRFGAQIFSTNSTLQGWDGRFKGEFCPVGTYIYLIEFINSKGEKITKKGTVALLD